MNSKSSRPQNVLLPNVYAGAYVDRMAELRKDDAALQSALSDGNAWFVPVWRERNLIAMTDQQPNALLLEHTHFAGMTIDPAQTVLLGKFRERLVFAIDMDADPSALMSAGEFLDLRQFGDSLPDEEAGLLAYARAMVIWRARHRYCGRCGSATRSTSGGHTLQCTNTECGLTQFPRIDPAIIVLVTNGEHALLGRQAPWPAGRYSTIAGFVEPGESLEDAVAREVLEETGVETGAIEYFSSQPWPFPTSLMLGFHAQARSTEIHLHDAELEDARWFTREEMIAGKVVMTSAQSIAFRLIEHWYDADAARPLREQLGMRVAGSTRT